MVRPGLPGREELFVVTMADVAARAGVSVSTVSHVLNATRPVSSSLTERVRAAVEETGYSLNAVARSLATSRTRLLGFVMSATSDPFFGRVFSSMEGTARRHGYSVLLSDSQDDPELEARQVRLMLDQQVSGLILAPASTRPGSALDIAARRGVPTTLVDRFADDRFDAVGAENVEATAALVGHLVGLGHRRIAYMAGRSGLTTTAERLEGYQLGLARAGLRPDRRLVRAGGSTTERAQAATHALLATRWSGAAGPPTAVVSGNNEMTIGVLRGLREAGRQVPGDVAVVSYDDVPHGDLVEPPLTAVAQPVADIGRVAVELLLGRLRAPDRAPRQRRMPPALVHRASCGCLQEPLVAPELAVAT